eukprot:TRINITY_DN11948_c0_g1_i1.p1 TRINITY_DN11948_c0_g1~~TRINITY_DN11948_c0_g1_i1.p1  ORF type:complete len:266 (+),score=32.19 TRINITY_DN11948_c0_g1_i1:308-1105(+)
MLNDIVDGRPLSRRSHASVLHIRTSLPAVLRRRHSCPALLGYGDQHVSVRELVAMALASALAAYYNPPISFHNAELIPIPYSDNRSSSEVGKQLDFVKSRIQSLARWLDLSYSDLESIAKGYEPSAVYLPACRSMLDLKGFYAAAEAIHPMELLSRIHELLLTTEISSKLLVAVLHGCILMVKAIPGEPNVFVRMLDISPCLFHLVLALYKSWIDDPDVDDDGWMCRLMHVWPTFDGEDTPGFPSPLLEQLEEAIDECLFLQRAT